MERKTRKGKRKDQNRIATSGRARVLRSRTFVCSSIALTFVCAVFPSVGCSSWRSLGRVDSPRGEYFLEEQDVQDIWSSLTSEDAGSNASIRGREVETYDASSGAYAEENKTGGSFVDRFTHMFRKPDNSPSSLEQRRRQENREFEDSSKYVKNDPALPQARASLSGRSDSYDAPKDSFWSKIFGTSRNVPKNEFESQNSIESRTGGLARDDFENRTNQNAPKERTPQEIQVRKRWTSRQTPDGRSTVAANPRNGIKLDSVSKAQKNAKSNVPVKPQYNAPSNVATKAGNDFGALLIRQYSSQRFLPPFDVIEQYYYPSGASVETTSKRESDSTLTQPIKTAVNNVDASERYRSNVYAPSSPSTEDSSVSQVSYYSQTPDSVSANARVPQAQNSDVREAQTQESSLLERRRQFSWFDDAPSSLTPREQAKESENETDSPEEGESVASKRLTADEILDEAARLQNMVDDQGISKNVSYEAPSIESRSPFRASPIHVLGTNRAVSSSDASSLVSQTDALNGAVGAINSIDERKSGNASAPLTSEEIEWVEHVEEAIQGLLAERAELKKRGESTSVCDARLRLLFLVVDEYDRQVQTIDDVYDPLRLFWEKECDGLEKLLHNQLEEIDPVFVAEALMSGLDSFFDVCDVQIRKALLVDAPACFGLFEARVKPYLPGEVVYAYAELDYVVSKETTRGHEIAVECRWRLLDSNGNALTDFQTQRCENVAETRLRDVVLNVAVPLSDEIVPNEYLLELEIVDLNARESVATTRRLPVRVVANPELGARG